MAIIEKVDSGKFARWIAESEGYKNNFSYEGACALQDYLDDLSEEALGHMEFDPIAWCCEYSEYKDMEDFWKSTSYDKEDYPDLESLQDNTTVIEFNGGFVIADF